MRALILLLICIPAWAQTDIRCEAPAQHLSQLLNEANLRQAQMASQIAQLREKLEAAEKVKK